MLKFLALKNILLHSMLRAISTSSPVTNINSCYKEGLNNGRELNRRRNLVLEVAHIFQLIPSPFTPFSNHSPLLTSLSVFILYV